MNPGNNLNAAASGRPLHGRPKVSRGKSNPSPRSKAMPPVSCLECLYRMRVLAHSG